MYSRNLIQPERRDASRPSPQRDMQSVTIRRMNNKVTASIDNVFRTYTYTFNLYQLPQAVDFINLFQEFRIKSATVTWLPQYPTGDAGKQERQAVAGTAWHMEPRLYALVDKAGNTYASEAEYLAVSGCKLVNDPYSEFTVKINKPAVSLLAYGTAGFAYGAVEESPWISMANAQIDHYGIQIGGVMSAVGGTGRLDYSVIQELEIEFRGVR